MEGFEGGLREPTNEEINEMTGSHPKHIGKREIRDLSYLAANEPLWGGHLERGEPLNDLNMIRWVELGLIKADGTLGYRLTDVGRAAIENSVSNDRVSSS